MAAAYAVSGAPAAAKINANYQRHRGQQMQTKSDAQFLFAISFAVMFARNDDAQFLISDADKERFKL